MPKVAVSLEYDTAALEQQNAAIRESPALYRTATNLELRRVRPLILADMRLKPRHSRAIRFVWSLDAAADNRARRWWFANYVKGKPPGVYQRTGATERATKVTGSADKTNGELSIEVPERAGMFVFNIDNRQIPSHALSGHPRIQDVAEKWRPILDERLSKMWFTISDLRGGIR